MSNWVQLGQDINGNTKGEETGRSLAISGDGATLAIGAQRFDNAKGQVRVYKVIGSNWVQIGDSINGEQDNNLLGSSVSLSKNGNILGIGIPGFNSNKGKVMIYEFIGTNWEKLGSDILGIDTSDFGHSVSLSDNGKIIGVGSTQDGKSKVYNFVDPNWEQLGEDFDNKGWSVSISGEGTIFVTSDIEDDNEKGLVKIYIYNETWTQLGGDIKGEQDFDKFGYSVSISSNGNYIVIGAVSNIIEKNSYFKVFKYNNSWQQIGSKITGSEEKFGQSVSISDDGKTVGIGSPYDEPNGNRSGNAFIYNYDGNNWNNTVSFDGKVNADENGYAVSLSDNGKIFAFGAPFSDVNFSSSGQARVFKLKESKPINPNKPKKKRKLRTFIKYGKSCGIVYFVTCLRSGLYRIVKKTRNNAGKLVTQEVRTLPTYNVAF
jgi:hypothetical protein